MTVGSETTPPSFHLEPRVAKAFFRFAGGFWHGDTQQRAWLLTLGLAASLVLSTYATVQMNHWNRWFFDALEKKDIASVQQAMLVFFLIVIAMAAIGVAIVLTRETLQVRWRAWLVDHLVGVWLDRQRFYHLNVTGREPPNPEYRISDDTRWATEILVDLGIGLLSAVIGGIAFIAILWNVGGAYTLGGITIPGYMVWLALAYGLAASTIMAWVGRPLVGRVGQKNEAEGYFRFAMMRLRENAESIALMKGGPAERAHLSQYYDGVVSRWLAIVKSHGHVTWITNASGPMIPILPLLFAAPKYLAGDLTLGQVTQLAAAFVQVQIAISWTVDNYNRIAEWYASARRVMDIVDASTAIDADIDRVGVEPGPADAALTLTGVVVRDTVGGLQLRIDALRVAPGESVHIASGSSTVKSALVRLVAGLLAPSAGSVQGVRDDRLMVLPQRPYLPLGTLHGALNYPTVNAVSPDRKQIEAALQVVGLGHLIQRLNDTERWSQVLSTAECQRLGVARLLLHDLDVIVFDDALSALDTHDQLALVATIRGHGSKAALVFLGQNPAPPGLPVRQLLFEQSDSGFTLKPVDVPHSERV
jgi:vitamin B12/bleomycin/antimicrobial peptide transport system ATP-binding/permease protein